MEITEESKTKIEKVFLNGYEYWLNRKKLVIYDKEEYKNGIYYYSDGISIKSNRLTNNEKQQILDYINYGR